MDVLPSQRPAQPHDPVLVAGVRTPIGTAGHGFAAVPVAKLAAPVLAALAAATAPAALPIDEVMLGNCLGPGGNVARSAALTAGLGTAVPAVTVDRQCGSGLEAIRLAALTVASGGASLVLAGGAESASTAPWRCWPPDVTHPGAPPVRYTRAPFAPPPFPDPEMGVAADDLAARRGISRERQDGYAARSHQRAVAAMRAGRFAAEIVPVAGLNHDERPREMTPQRLSRLPAAFLAADARDTAGGTVTAGNASGISDAAAAVAVTTRRAAAAAGLPAVEVVSSAVVASDPALPGAAAGPAAARALQQARLRPADIGIIEVTEAFASVALAFADDLGIDETRLCADGGAIALGHPWGASGAFLVVRLLAQLAAPGPPEYGLAACAIGGGQGIAMVLRRVSDGAAA